VRGGRGRGTQPNQTSKAMGLFAWGWWGPRGEGGPLDLGVGGSHIGQCTYRDSGQL